MHYLYTPIEFIEHDYDCTAEVEIKIGGKTVGYVGGSRHVDGLLSDAERVVGDILFDLIGKHVADHPRVTQKSFMDHDEEDHS